MTITVTKPGIIIDVVGSYFYDKKIMTKNWLFVLGGLETQLHDILWAVHDGKNHGRSEGEENFRELPLTVYEGTWTYSPLSLLCITMILRVRRNFIKITAFPNTGAERCAFLSYTYARVCEALALIEPERGVGL